MHCCRNVNRAIWGLCGLLTATPACAQPDQGVPRVNPNVQLRHTMREQINTGLVGIVSEGIEDTVDLALSLAEKQERLRLLPIAGVGPLQNAKDVMFARGIDLGIIQSDVLDEIKRNPPFTGVENYLQYITTLYDQELHILVGRDIQSVQDLSGKKVNFGPRDGGTYTTATNVFNALSVNVEMTNLAQPIALDKLRRGEISALVSVATKPSRLFHDIRPEENLQFLAITGDLPANYSATAINADDYPELVAQEAPVRTIAVGTVLVTYNWPIKSERYQRVNRFVQAFFAHLEDIKARHPKWRDFDINASVTGWTRYPPAEQWIKQAGLTPQITTASAAEPPRRALDAQAQILDPQEREALFREFAAYERRESLFKEFATYVRLGRAQHL
jgi:TRAP-type uncharacterized transport system substrate-binding protein